MQALVMQERALPPNRPICLVEHREMRDPDERFVGLLKRHEHAPESIPADKIARAVNRVDNPPPSARSDFAGAFLPQNGVVGEPTLDPLPDKTLVLFIRDRDR